MKLEQTAEERKLLEYLAQIYFNTKSIAPEQLYPIALYLYQNRELGPRGTKKAAAYLVRLHNQINTNANDLTQQTYKKLKKCFNLKPVQRFVLEEAKRELKLAETIIHSGNFVYEAYYNIFLRCYNQLKMNVDQKSYSQIYFITKELSQLLLKNQKKQQEITTNLLQMKERLVALAHTSKDSKKIMTLAHAITEIEEVMEGKQYRKMQETLHKVDSELVLQGYQKQLMMPINTYDNKGTLI